MRPAGREREASDKLRLKMCSTKQRTKKQRSKLKKGKRGELLTFCRT